MAYNWDQEPPTFKTEIGYTVYMSQKDLNDVLTKLEESSSSFVPGYAQQVETPPPTTLIPTSAFPFIEQSCFCCDKEGHQSLDCPNSPLSKCCYCGEEEHMTFECALLKQPQTTASSANSATTKSVPKSEDEEISGPDISSA